MAKFRFKVQTPNGIQRVTVSAGSKASAEKLVKEKIDAR